MGLRAFAWQGFSLVYGMFGLVVMTVVAAARDRAFNDHPTPEETKELEIGMWSSRTFYIDHRRALKG